MEDHLNDVKKNISEAEERDNSSAHHFRKVIEHGGGFAGRMMRIWKHRQSALEMDLEKSLMNSAWECKDSIKVLSVNLLEQLKKLERLYSSDDSMEDDSSRQEFIEKWIATMKRWKRHVFEIKCELKVYLNNEIKKHCDFLSNLNQFHPEYIKWKISRIIMETNKIIMANEDAFEKTQMGLFQSALDFVKNKGKQKYIQDITEPLDTEHDAINLNYDDLALEEERLKQGVILQPLEEIRTDTTLSSLVDWLARLRETMLKPLPIFRSYDVWNLNLQTALDHLENCKTTVMRSGLDFLDVVEPHLRDEMLGIKQPNVEQLSSQDRTSVERWMECIAFFEFTMKNTTDFILLSGTVWNKHVCRLETVRQLVQNILRDLLTQQNYQQMKIEQKINVFLDGIREAANSDEIDFNVKNINKLFIELEKLYERTYETGLEEVKGFSVGCKEAREVFRSEAAVCLAKHSENNVFPEHGSELDVTFDPIMDLHHWEVIKQTFKSYANWHVGLVEGINLLCQVEREKESWETQWEEGLSRHLSWSKDVKDQALNRRKERFQVDLVLPRLKELEAHSNILHTHLMGVEKVFGEKNDWLDNLKCSLLTIADRLQREYNYLTSAKNLNNDIYSRNRLVIRINKFEVELQKAEETKVSILEGEMQVIKKKFTWLQKANQRILASIRLFCEGGSFSSPEALEFADKIKAIHSEILKEERAALDSILIVAKNINPTKNIDTQIFSGIKQMFHYKTKKESVEEMAELIMDKLQEVIRVELTSARKFCIELCDVIGCSQAPLESLHELITKFALYLKFPQESSLLECEDLQYMIDFSDDPSSDKNRDKKTDDDSCLEEVNSDEKMEEAKDCKQLLSEAAELENNKKGKGGGILNEKNGGKGGKGGTKNMSNEDDDGKGPSGSKKGGKGKKGTISDDDITGKGKGKSSKKNDIDDSKDGKRRGRKKDGKTEIGLDVERKNVLRDTKCEQLRRAKQIKELEDGRRKSSAGGDKGSSDDKGKKGSKKRTSKGKKKSSDAHKSKDEKGKGKGGERKSDMEKSNKLSAGDRRHMESGREDIIVQIGDLTINFAGGYLFKYTGLPVPMSVCNYLLFTKKTIFEHFVQIQSITEKFFMSDHSEEIKKVWSEFSPKDDFKRLTTRLLKRLRILNIHCEHSWIILTHDFLCMVRALHCATEERIRKELDEIENKWKLNFSGVCCEYEAALNEAIEGKTHKAARLIGKLAFTGCENTDVGTLHQDIEDHCNQHVEEIKTIWSGYTRGLSERYLENKDDLAAFSERTEETRKLLGSDKTILSLFMDLKDVAERFDSTIKIFLEKSTNGTYGSENYLYQEVTYGEKNPELEKLEMLQTLLKAIQYIIENFEINYLEKKEDQNRLPDEIPIENKALRTVNVDIQKRRNLFLHQIIRNIKVRHQSFRRICNDQMGITVKWLDSWQKNNSIEMPV